MIKESFGLNSLTNQLLIVLSFQTLAALGVGGYKRGWGEPFEFYR